MYKTMLQKYIDSFMAISYFCCKHEPSEGGV